VIELCQRSFFDAVTLSRRRSYREFAETEIIIPTGPRKGLPFSCAFMAFSGAVLDAYQDGAYSRFFLSGPVQAGKTFLGFIIPALYHLFELEEEIILGAPVIEMAQAAYLERLLPAIEASRYARLLPVHGGGSRGGRAPRVTFLNGAGIRFMGAGGGDQQRSSHAARVVIATELDKMDEPGRASREADPVSQLEARSRAFGAAARFYGECTMSTEEGRIYREVVLFGSDSRVHLPCQHCGEYVFPERKSFSGWQEAPDVLAARSRSTFLCPSCGKAWTEFDRQKSIQGPKVAARGQTLTAAGELVGDPPPTNTFGFRWNAMASPLLTMADIGEAEWRAEQSDKPADKRAPAQFSWAEPYRGDSLDVNRIESATVLAKIVAHERGAIPEGTIKLTLAIDVGSYVCWWVLMAWKSGAKGHVVDFGSIDVPLEDGKKSPVAVLAALRAFRDDVINPGWAGGRRPDLVLVDSGYEHETVYRFVVESGEGKYLACKGFGQASRNGFWRAGGLSSVSRQVGNEWRVVLQPVGVRLVEINSDFWKSAVHDGFGSGHGAPGSLTLFNRPPTDPALKIYARQVTAEYREVDPNPNKELRIKWVVRSKQNHYLDCTSYNRAAADILGVKLVRPSAAPIKSQASHQPPPDVGGRRSGIRRHY
jgi:phage terminase large subunit GpA-like protein